MGGELDVADIAAHSHDVQDDLIETSMGVRERTRQRVASIQVIECCRHRILAGPQHLIDTCFEGVLLLERQLRTRERVMCSGGQPARSRRSHPIRAADHDRRRHFCIMCVEHPHLVTSDHFWVEAGNDNAEKPNRQRARHCEELAVGLPVDREPPRRHPRGRSPVTGDSVGASTQIRRPINLAASMRRHPQALAGLPSQQHPRGQIQVQISGCDSVP